MKLKSIIASCLTGVILLTHVRLHAGVAVLQLEKSTNALTWEKVRLDASLLTTSGGVVQNLHEPGAFYRLRIRDDKNAGFISAIPLIQVPGRTLEVAKRFLADLKTEDPDGEGDDPEGGWADVELGPVCYPVYDPAVDGGKSPAYIEFKVIRTAQSTTAASPNDPFGMSPPDAADDCFGVGHLLVANTTNDVPVPSFSQSGPTPVELLLRKSRGSGPVKPVRYDDGLLVGEDEAGAIVCSIGNVPFSIDPGILEKAGKEFEGFHNEQETGDDGAPEFPAKAYDSYREFKEDFATNPVFKELRRLRALRAAQEWNSELGIDPEIIQVQLGQRTLVLQGRRVQSATVADPQIAAVNVPTAQNGLLVTGQAIGGTVLVVEYADGSSESFILSVASRLQGGVITAAGVGSWTAWKYWYAGNWSDQRRYKQFQHDPQMCTGGASGCGPAAWAMLYGWWDRKGAPRLIKNTGQADSPLYNDDSVLDCNRYVFDQVGPFCVSGQAATMPWNMKWGYKWAEHRGAGINITWTWGLPYLSFGSISKVATSIKNGRPSIVGLGYYWHYPLAYGYKVREYKALGITWDTQRYFKCNMGWGGDSAEWHNASSSWFGTEARFW